MLKVSLKRGHVKDTVAITKGDSGCQNGPSVPPDCYKSRVVDSLWGEKLSAESHEIIVGSGEVSREVLRRRGHKKGTIAPNAAQSAAPAT